MQDKTAKIDKNNLKKTGRYHLDSFEKIGDEKRRRIIESALIEFSSKGYNGANINIIAKNAGISIGSMYQYFGSKEKLFLTVIDIAYGIIERSLAAIDRIQGDIYIKLDQIIDYVQKYSREYRLLNQIYLEATTQGLAALSKNLSHKMETVSSSYYKSLLSAAIKQGLVDKKISVDTASFCLDNIILLLQFSYSSDYYMERMKIFAGAGSQKDDKRIREEIMYILKKILAP